TPSSQASPSKLKLRPPEAQALCASFARLPARFYSAWRVVLDGRSPLEPARLHLPPTGKQVPRPGLCKAVIQQINHATVIGGADHAAGGLHDFLHPRVEVGVVVAVGLAEHVLHAGFDFFVDHVELGQAEGGDEGADQAFAGQVDAFAECAAQYGKADACRVVGETVEKGLPLAFLHVAGLHAGGD